MNVFTVPIDKLYMDNKMEGRPELIKMFRSSPRYKMIYDDLHLRGMINPLLIRSVSDKYAVVVGWKRYLAGLELGYKEFKCILMPNREPKTAKEYKKKYYVITGKE